MSFKELNQGDSYDMQSLSTPQLQHFDEMHACSIRMDALGEPTSDSGVHVSQRAEHPNHEGLHESEKHLHEHSDSQHATAKHAHHHAHHETEMHGHHHKKGHGHHSNRRASDAHLPGFSVADETQYQADSVEDKKSGEQNVHDLIDGLWCTRFGEPTTLASDQSSSTVQPPQPEPSRGTIHELPSFALGQEVQTQWRPGDPAVTSDQTAEKVSSSHTESPTPEYFEIPAAIGTQLPTTDVEQTPPVARTLTDQTPTPKAPGQLAEPAPPTQIPQRQPLQTAEQPTEKILPPDTARNRPQTNGDTIDTVSSTLSDRAAAELPAIAVNNTGHFNVALINDMEQIPMTGALPNNRQNTVYAAKNETQSVKIAIQAPPQGLTNVDVSVSSLTSADGSKLDNSNIKLYREHYVQVTRSSNSAQKANPANPAGAPGWYEDGLIPFIDPATGQPGRNPQSGLEGNNFKVQGGQNQPIWADVQVPADAKAGEYSGVVTIKSDQGQVQVPLRVHVWNFEALTKPYLTTAFGATGTNNDAVQQVLLDNKISPVAPDPGHMSQDMAKGLTGASVGFFSGASYDKPTMSAAPSVNAIEARKAAIEQAAGAGNNLHIYDYSADEIGGRPQLYPQIQQYAANLHAAGVDNLITMAPTPELLSDGTNSGKPAVDIFTMLPVQYDKTAASVMHDFRSKGAQMWSYNTLVQDDYSPKWELDYSPLNERLQAGHISQSDGLTGLLGWSVSNWSSDPWHNPYNAFVEPGEGVLVLPGAQAGLQGDAATIRLKALRDGVGDYNYAQILKNLGNSQLAEEVSHSVGASFSNWSHDPAAVEKAHELMGNEIEKLQQKQ